MKIPLLFCLGLLCVVCSCSDVPVHQTGSNLQVASPINETPLLNACLSHDEIATKLFAMAKARSQAEADQLKEVLLNESRRSKSCRSSLIESIVRTMDMPESAFKDDGTNFNIWRESAVLLGDLKASEALDFLVEHLNFSSGIFSTTMSQQPALKSVIRIGDSAIPKLSEVLRQHSNPSMRMFSVYCLSAIGGPTAVQALKEALPLQSDRCVKGFVQASIEALDNDQQIVLDTNKWFSAFLCNGKPDSSRGKGITH